MAGSSRLRIIAGEFRGREIEGPGRLDLRPTADRVRESLFDILARHIQGMRILDLCAGTGAFGLESLSRGARAATFLDADPQVIKLIERNIESLGVGERSTVVRGELPYALGKLKGPFDLVFFDPPYKSDIVTKVLPRLASKTLLVPNALVIVERDRRSHPIKVSHYAIDRRHRIGDAELWFLRRLPPGMRTRGSGDE
ncbi:MAG TPA: 16S rRNA (guanine(966)-N(2))-methyltransferase RsmD [Bdellovibrionota bacterium]|nr:16S rRNA (guanine(966)-N(2))-methyltransferase RsmD [Bdellovibrionota bacterium]